MMCSSRLKHIKWQRTRNKPVSQSNELFDYNDLIVLFNNTFKQSLDTCLVKGGDEPIYLPKDEQHPLHRIIFARGYFASALHEMSHWLVAGCERRLLEDFGYWYCPDGRDETTQRAFEQVEVKPQAIEWALSLACGHPFRVSTDNLSGWQSNRQAFQDNVYKQLCDLIKQGFNDRTQQLLDVLQAHYRQPPLTIAHINYQVSQSSTS